VVSLQLVAKESERMVDRQANAPLRQATSNESDREEHARARAAAAPERPRGAERASDELLHPTYSTDETSENALAPRNQKPLAKMGKRRDEERGPQAAERTTSTTALAQPQPAQQHKIRTCLAATRKTARQLPRRDATHAPEVILL